ncbi:NnrS family protein [Gilvimarinus sp. F26214L]|uniref:NnrS family protein n=1 Tax=Gilvimarinus sp. DZF01 TaxID=3461371 RepID=UPI0040464CD9
MPEQILKLAAAGERRLPSLLAHPFRPFFVMVGVYGVLVVLAWMAFLFGGWPLPIGWSPLQWHAHEMLYGLVPAAIAGFLLTAMTNWTGAKPLQGGALLAMLLLWAAGRAVMWFAGWLPGWLVAAVDLAFLPVLAVYVASVLIRHRNRRNLILVAVLTLLFSGNLLMQLGLVSGSTGLLARGQQLGFDLITVLMVVIGGRIIPAFSGNWLRAQGDDPAAIRTWPVLERAALGSVALLVVLDAFAVGPQWIGTATLLAAALHALRLFGWSGWRVLREPLLWILHLAYLWIVLALLLRGLSAFVDAVPASLWQHALGLGGIATLILGVMTRVAVGHTGRPLQLPRSGLLIYLAIFAATLLRLIAAVGWIDYRVGVLAAALFWVLAFSLFLALYVPILAAPRPDGRPG